MNQNQSGHVSSPNCFPSVDMIPYANKMLAVMQNDPRFAGKTFSQADLLNWFGAEGRRWCSKQELFEQSDVVSVNLVLSERSRWLVDA